MRGKGEEARGKREGGDLFRLLLVRVLFLLLSLSLFPFAWAHPANVPSAQIKVAPDGTFTARVRFDVVAFATLATPRDADDRAMSALIDGPDDALAASLADAAGRFRRGFSALDGGVIDRLEFPTVGTVRRFLAGNPSPRLPAMLTTLVWGHLPRGARTIAFRYPDLFDTVIQTVEFPYREPVSEPVDTGHASSTLTIPTPEEIARTSAIFATPRGTVPAARGELPKVPASPKPVVADSSLWGRGGWGRSRSLPKLCPRCPLQRRMRPPARRRRSRHRTRWSLRGSRLRKRLCPRSRSFGP